VRAMIRFSVVKSWHLCYIIGSPDDEMYNQYFCCQWINNF